MSEPFKSPDSPEQSVRLALEGARLGTWSLDLESDEFALDDGAARILGIGIPEFGGTYSHALSLIHPDDREEVVTMLDRSVDQGHDFRSEHRVIRGDDGRTIWIESRGRVELSSEGRPLRFRGTLQDVTERKTAEVELRRDRDLLERQSRLLRHAEKLAGIGGWDWDPRSGSVHWTEGMYQLRGLNPASSEPTLEALLEGFLPESREQVEEVLDAVVRGAGPQELLVESETPEGETRWLRLLCHGVFDGPQVASVCGIMMDVTDRRRDQELMVRAAQGISEATGDRFLEEAVRDLAATFDASEAFLGIVDESGTEAVVRTPVRISEGKPAPPVEYDLAGSPCLEVCQDELVIVPRGVRDRFPEDELLIQLQAEAYAGAPVRDSNGRVVGVLAVLTRTPLQAPPAARALLRIYASRVGAEIARQEAEQALRNKENELHRAQKLEAVGKLAGGVAHDFNNLLTVINGYTDLLLADLDADPPDRDHLRELVTEIRRSGHRASTITRQLLAFNSRQALQLEPVELNDLLADLAPVLEPRLETTIELHIQTGDAPCWVRADPGQLEQALMELSLATLASGAQESPLRISCQAVQLEEEPDSRLPEELDPGSFACILVGALDRCPADGYAFQPLVGSEEPLLESNLNLSTTYGVVRQSGGYVDTWRDEAQPMGYRILLPLVEIPEIPGNGSQEAADSPGGAKRILLVEDDDAVRNFIQRILERSGYRVLEARNGFEAEELAQDAAFSPDLLLVDVVMPGRSGRETALAIRRHRKEIRVLYISGYTDRVLASDDAGVPGSDFLQKPFSAERLIRKVAEVLGQVPDDAADPTAPTGESAT